MPAYTFEHVTTPSHELVEASVALFAQLMSTDAAMVSLCGGDAGKVGDMGRAMLKAGIFAAGEYYVAKDENGNLAGYTMWMPPGQELFSTPEQRELGLNEFMAKLSKEGKEYYSTILFAEFPAFVNSCLGPTGKFDSWWLHMAMVRPESQRQGVATSLIQLAREKAKRNGETLACSTTTPTNVIVYQNIGFDLKGQRIMPSPWGDWPLYVFSLDTSRAS